MKYEVWGGDGCFKEIDAATMEQAVRDYCRCYSVENGVIKIRPRIEPVEFRVGVVLVVEQIKGAAL